MSIEMDADTDCILLAVNQAPGVHAFGACTKGDIVFIRRAFAGVLTPWPLSIRILFSLLCFFVVSLFDSNDDFLLAPAADVALDRGLGDVEAGCRLLEVLRGEHSREAGEELFFALDALGSGLGEL